MRLRSSLLAASLLFTTNCMKADGTEVIKKHRPAVEEVLENAQKVLAKARKEPEAGDGDALPDDAPATKDTSDEVLTEQIEELEKIEDDGAKSPKMDLAQSGRLAACARILHQKDTSNPAAFDIQRCAKAKYVLVVRVREYHAPEKKGSSKEFTPGEASGDAVLYRLKGAKKIGAFAFKATNSKKVSVAKSAAEFDLRKDLERAVTSALSAGGHKGSSADDE